MTEITLYEEAMCCSTGVCGPDPDDELVEVSAALDQLEDEFDVEVTRANMQHNIDQEQALEEYREQVLSHVREMYEDREDTELDVEAAIANVEEELESPCAEEMAALEKFVSYF